MFLPLQTKLFIEKNSVAYIIRIRYWVCSFYSNTELAYENIPLIINSPRMLNRMRFPSYTTRKLMTIIPNHRRKTHSSISILFYYIQQKYWPSVLLTSTAEQTIIVLNLKLLYDRFSVGFPHSRANISFWRLICICRYYFVFCLCKVLRSNYKRNKWNRLRNR